ncbi:MAG TPA: neutral/alkaline non-lysosomal ceramidase N-terminal domain-containing protein, partial [Thermomicrobiales bacterium]|nr:neutral/alkaline non-lysosomal ceramidase N-terminal domain-containing protein [Thermomicrobiales bacterium]
MNIQHKQWAAGVAAATFSIEEGTPLAGYAARSGASVGTLDVLFITALILQERNNRLVILSADVAAVDVDLRREVSSAAGLKYSELAICASHTHSGPAGVVARLHPADSDRLDRELRSRFILTAAEVIEAARSGMTPVD